MVPFIIVEHLTSYIERTTSRALTRLKPDRLIRYVQGSKKEETLEEESGGS